LTDIGAPFNDDILANIMLGGLPESFQTIIDALEGVNGKLSSDIVKERLLSLHNGGHNGVGGSSSDSAIFQSRTKEVPENRVLVLCATFAKRSVT